MEQQQQTQIGWPAARPLLFPLPSLSSCALQACSDGARLRGSIGAISRVQSSLPSPAPLPLPSRARRSLTLPACAKCLLFPLRAQGACCALAFPLRADPPWPWEVALASTRRLGNAFPRKATPYAGMAWQAGRLHWEIAWMPWRRLGDAVKTMVSSFMAE